MDPNATLRELRELLGGDHSGSLDPETASMDDLCRMEELWQALDQWIGRGGFLPDAWKEAQEGS